MIRRWVVAALLASPQIAMAELIEGTGATASDPITECTLDWAYSSGDEATIDGFRFEVAGVKTAKAAKTLRQIDCRRLGLSSGMNSIKMYAFNGDEYSEPSNSVEFYYLRTTARANYNTDPALVPPVIHITIPSPPAI